MRRKCLFAVSLSIAFSSGARTQDIADARPLFYDDSSLALTIEGPFERLTRERHEKPELDGVVRYTDADGKEVVLDVGLSPRGNSRLEICSFPPLWLNFRRRQLPGTVFAGRTGSNSSRCAENATATATIWPRNTSSTVPTMS